MNRKAVYPGTFDPVTHGHIDIIERASRVFDHVFVAVAHSYDKKPLFSVKERLEMISEATKHLANVTVEDFSGLIIKYVQKKKSMVIVRGLRVISDFEYEFQMALTNRKLAGNIETIFMMTNENYSYLSSKLIKEALTLGADIKSFVPDFVAKKLKNKLDGKPHRRA